MFHVLLAGLITIAQTQAPDAAATPTPAIKPALDIFGTTLTPGLRRQIRADHRCNEAADSTDAFAKSNGSDIESGMKAMVLLETCASLPRVMPQTGPAVFDWSEYADYVITAAAAIAYQLGFDTDQPSAYLRAEFDASHVRGYDAPQSIFVQTYGAIPNGTVSNQALPFDNPVASGFNSAANSMYATMPMQNSKAYFSQITTRHTTGYAGPYGAQATAIADAAAQAYNKLPREPHPQAAATPAPK